MSEIDSEVIQQITKAIVAASRRRSSESHRCRTVQTDLEESLALRRSGSFVASPRMQCTWQRLLLRLPWRRGRALVQRFLPLAWTFLRRLFLLDLGVFDLAFWVSAALMDASSSLRVIGSCIVNDRGDVVILRGTNLMERQANRA